MVLAEDTRTTGVLLKHHGISARLVSHHKFNEHATADAFAARMAAGETMALVSDAGTPGISDPGFMLVRAAVAQGVEVQCLPGATAFVPALVSLCFAAPKSRRVGAARCGRRKKAALPGGLLQTAIGHIPFLFGIHQLVQHGAVWRRERDGRQR